MKSPRSLRSLALLTLIVVPVAEAAVCRVAPNGTGNGASWSSPTALQAALTTDTCTEVWVRKGLYTPVVPADRYPTDAERAISFVIRAGTRVYGGFAGNESLRDARDAQANRSVLSGDIDGNDITDADGIVTDPDNVLGSNSHHVVLMNGGTAPGPITRGTMLDGVVITSGRAESGDTNHRNRGGGLLCLATNTSQQCSPTLRDVLFSGNRGSYGGAMHVLGSTGGIARPRLDRVRFSRNKASDGGALYNDGSNAGNASPELVDVEFTGNRASRAGGAMYNNGEQGSSSPSLARAGFSGNSATTGGALYNDASGAGSARAYIVNTTFANNNASSGGGAIYSYTGNGDGRMVLLQATFSGNSAVSGGAIYNSGSSNNIVKAGQTVVGTILWGNSASTQGAEIYNSYAEPAIRDSMVAGGCPNGAQCSGLLSGNPALGVLGDNGGFSQTMLPGTGSAAIDAAVNGSCPSTDQRAVPRAQGIRCDIGAVEVEAPACYVKHDASGSNNGSSWANAYKSLQSALASTNCGEIRVARGIYRPTDGTDTSISFDIRPGQRVYGGFNGTEARLDQRDPAANRTVLSGDIDRNDATDADGIVVDIGDIEGSNSKRIVKMDGTRATGSIHANTVLEGFAIAGASGDSSGGGLYCKGNGSGKECSPTLRNLLFSANAADEGGGLYNFADDGGRANPILVNITFRNNRANYGGGGLNNRAWNGGEASPTLVNVTFVGNSAVAMINDGSYAGNSSPLLNHVTFHANTDRSNAASMWNSGRLGGTSEPILSNVIMWGGSFWTPGEPGECAPDGHIEICNSSAQPTIRASLIAGGCPAGAICGPDVRDLDPKLGPPSNTGGVGVTLVPAMDSPAVDSGADDVCVDTDQRGISRPQGPRCDIGAVEMVNDRLFANGFD